MFCYSPFRSDTEEQMETQESQKDENGNLQSVRNQTTENQSAEVF